MKAIAKAALIVAAVFIAAGICLTVAGSFMGADGNRVAGRGHIGIDGWDTRRGVDDFDDFFDDIFINGEF